MAFEAIVLYTVCRAPTSTAWREGSPCRQCGNMAILLLQRNCCKLFALMAQIRCRLPFAALAMSGAESASSELFWAKISGSAGWSALHQLRYIYLDSNNISGQLPGSWGSTLVDLVHFSASFNVLSGTLPAGADAALAIVS